MCRCASNIFSAGQHFAAPYHSQLLKPHVSRFTSTLGNRRLIRDGAQDGHLDFHTAPELCSASLYSLSDHKTFLSSLHLY